MRKGSVEKNRPFAHSSGEKILLHVCCAPCSTYCIEYLKQENWNVVGFFYNPNIYPTREYHDRLEEARKFCGKSNILLHTGEYDTVAWDGCTHDVAHLGEGSQRCELCFEHRLARTVEFAVNCGIDHVATTLTISPHKNSNKIFQIGQDLVRENNITFQPYNFKKRDGFKRSVVICRDVGLFRQNYCGCRYSLEEKSSR